MYEKITVDHFEYEYIIFDDFYVLLMTFLKEKVMLDNISKLTDHYW